MKKLSIVIVNWNTNAYLVKCLESIRASSSEADIEVIVVDNNSDESLDTIRHAFPEIRLLKCDFNYGFATATNVGVGIASGEYLMTLNPDTVLDRDTIQQLLSVLDQYKDTGIAVPVLRDEEVFKRDFTFFRLYVDSLFVRVGKRITNRFREPAAASFEVNWISGTGYIVRRTCLDRGQMFGEDHFLFGEEFSLCERVAKVDQKIRVVPSAKFEHHVSVTFKNDPERLFVAAKLGSALAWAIRKRRWGGIVTGVIGVIIFWENLLKYFAAKGGRAIYRDSLRFQKMAAQAKASVVSFFPLISNDEEFIKTVDREAAVFFNGGRMPILPPSFREIGRKA